MDTCVVNHGNHDADSSSKGSDAVLAILASFYAEPQSLTIRGIELLAQIQVKQSGATLVALVKGFEVGVETKITESVLQKARLRLEQVVTDTVAELVDHYHESLIANSRK